MILGQPDEHVVNVGVVSRVNEQRRIANDAHQVRLILVLDCLFAQEAINLLLHKNKRFSHSSRRHQRSCVVCEELSQENALKFSSQKPLFVCEVILLHVFGSFKIKTFICICIVFKGVEIGFYNFFHSQV